MGRGVALGGRGLCAAGQGWAVSLAGRALCGAGPARRAGRWRWRRQSLRRRRWRLWGLGGAPRCGAAGLAAAGSRRREPGGVHRAAEAVERLRGTRERGAERTEVTEGSGPGGAGLCQPSSGRGGSDPSLDSRGWRRRPRRDLGRALPAPHRAAPRSEPLSVSRAGVGAEAGSTKGSGRPSGSEWGLPVRA